MRSGQAETHTAPQSSLRPARANSQWFVVHVGVADRLAEYHKAA